MIALSKFICSAERLFSNDRICPESYRPGILYGNPKIHKPFVDNLRKFRPILSAINTPE